MKILKSTLIVPCNSNVRNFNFFLENICTWNSLPKEIIFINTNKKKIMLEKYYRNLFRKKKIIIRILDKPNLFPGAARNIGISYSSNEIISFLDIGTHASKEWLETGYDQIRNKNFLISWGNTFYLATSNKDKIIRASTYGQIPIQTLPGSTMKRDLFKIVGVFLKDVRAGEDAEWMYRVRLHNIKSCKNDKIIFYQHLLGTSYLSIIKKWFRNYSFSRRLSYLNNNKESYYIALSIILILIAFNWNPIMTDWGKEGYEENLIYLPHITKITVSFILLFYFILRGIYLPLKKNVSLKFLFPIAVFKIITLSFLIDLTKLASFIYSRFKIK